MAEVPEEITRARAVAREAAARAVTAKNERARAEAREATRLGAEQARLATREIGTGLASVVSGQSFSIAIGEQPTALGDHLRQALGLQRVGPVEDETPVAADADPLAAEETAKKEAADKAADAARAEAERVERTAKRAELDALGAAIREHKRDLDMLVLGARLSRGR